MDSAMYDELNLTPISSDETYSRLRTTQTKIKPNDELQRRADIDQSATKGVKPTSTKEASSNTKFNTVLITMIVILLLFMLASIALSVTTFSRLTSEQSKLAKQLDKIEDTRSELNFTQLILTQNNISQILAELDNRFISSQIIPRTQSHCGAGLWWRVAYLDMTEPLQQCPSAWREYNTSGVRACGRPVNSTGSCAAVFYFTNCQYSRVCGRVLGYQVASPDAFKQVNNNGKDLDGGDLDGVIISHGACQNYIWSYAAGLTERSTNYRRSNCPCSTEAGTEPPASIRDNYYCESGNPNDMFEKGQLYSSDPLWDGQQCEGTCCTGTKSPPWFSVQLPTPTTDIIEVSICCDQGTMDEDTPVELIEIYVQ